MVLELLSYNFFQNALLGSLFTAIVCGIMGTYIVSRRLVFISGGITHASFGGLGLGFFLGINPLITAVLFSLLSALGVEWLSRSQEIREDSAIASIWSLGMAIGAIFTFLTPGFAPNLSSYLFGNILTVSLADLQALAVLSFILILLFAFFLKTIIYVAFDRNFAITQNIPVRLIEYGMMCLISLSIVFSIRIVGIMLLLSMLTLPQMTVNLFTSDFKKIMIGSVALGLVACIVGLFGSYYFNLPSGAVIIVTLALAFLITKQIVARN